LIANNVSKFEALNFANGLIERYFRYAAKAVQDEAGIQRQ
jgi:hypothetical protein